MTSLSESLVASDPSKSAFLEFSHGYQTHQQHSPGVSHAHYPVHGLHQGAHPQYETAFSSGAPSYGRPLSYHYPSAHHHPGAYLPYQHSSHNSAAGHSRVEDGGNVCFSLQHESKKEEENNLSRVASKLAYLVCEMLVIYTESSNSTISIVV